MAALTADRNTPRRTQPEGLVERYKLKVSTTIHAGASVNHGIENAGALTAAGGTLYAASSQASRLYSVDTGNAEAADRWLHEDVMAVCPRLALLLAGRVEEARRRYDSVSGTPGGPEAGPADAALDLAAETHLVCGTLALHGGEELDSETVRARLADFARLAESPRADAAIRAHAEHGLAIANSLPVPFFRVLHPVPHRQTDSVPVASRTVFAPICRNWPVVQAYEKTA